MIYALSLLIKWALLVLFSLALLVDYRPKKIVHMPWLDPFSIMVISHLLFQNSNDCDISLLSVIVR